MAHLTIRVPEQHVAALRCELVRAYEERERSGASVEADDLLDALEQLPESAAGRTAHPEAPAGSIALTAHPEGRGGAGGRTAHPGAPGGGMELTAHPEAPAGSIELTAHPEVLSDAVHAVLAAALAELSGTVEAYWRGADLGAAVSAQVASVASLAGLFREVQGG